MTYDPHRGGVTTRGPHPRKHATSQQSETQRQGRIALAIIWGLWLILAVSVVGMLGGW